MGASLAIAALWVAFGGTHVFLSSRRTRGRLVGVIGEARFLGLYSLIAFATFVPLVWVYFDHRHEGPMLWAPLAMGPLLRPVLYSLMGVAFVLMAGGLLEPSPAMMGTSGPARVHGIHRITRHALFMGVGIVGLLHLLWNGWLTDVVFFAGLPLFALIGCAHQDRRKLADLGDDYAAWHAQTPFLPFTGRDTLRGLRELRPSTVAVGIALTFLARFLHSVGEWFAD